MAEGAKAAGASRVIGVDIDSKKFDVGIAPSPSPHPHGFWCWHLTLEWSMTIYLCWRQNKSFVLNLQTIVILLLGALVVLALAMAMHVLVWICTHIAAEIQDQLISLYEISGNWCLAREKEKWDGHNVSTALLRIIVLVLSYVAVNEYKYHLMDTPLPFPERGYLHNQLLVLICFHHLRVWNGPFGPITK